MITRKVRITDQMRERIAKAFGFRCGYCETSQFTIGYRLAVDFIASTATGGKLIEKNLCLACVPCGEFKGARDRAIDPMTSRRVRLFNPRLQKWKSHFRFSEDGTEIVGLTSCGRATVDALRFNRAEIVAARSLWVQVGWWPPRD